MMDHLSKVLLETIEGVGSVVSGGATMFAKQRAASYDALCELAETDRYRLEDG